MPDPLPPPPAAPPPDVPRRWWRRGGPGVWGPALLLTLGLFALLLFVNRQYLFHARLYEQSDWAADSLLVRDAKVGLVLHGHYSRWGFYHPGPALLYVYALGEIVFYNFLRVVPTPFNGQMVGLGAVMTFFFSYALATFARRLGPARGGYAFFLPLALIFAAWHYGSATHIHPFLETWPASPLVLAMLCFLVTAASVASGGGADLPVLVLSGSFLVHNHVAQPLFVVPLSVLAYAGLLWSQPPAGPGGARWTGRLAGPWRAFPRAHVAAGGVLALFVLPLLLDAAHGSGSNLARILAYVRGNHEPHKSFGQAANYLLTYGAYTFYDARQGQFFGDYSAAGMRAFVGVHWRAYLGWAVTLLAPAVLFAAARRVPPPAPAPGEQGAAATVPARFIPWFYAVVAAAFGLTILWGIKQTGEMFYFNAYFNYSIYYCLALGLAGALAVFLQALTSSAPSLAAARRVVGAALWAGAAVAGADQAGAFQLHTMDTPEMRASHRVVDEAARATLPPGATCYLDCEPWDVWPVAVAVALQLDRAHYKVRVSDDWSIMFGQARTITHEPTDWTRPIVRWRVLPLASDPARAGRWPLAEHCGLIVSTPVELDPAGGTIPFDKTAAFQQYAFYGWSNTDADWTWSNQRQALLQFRPLPLPPESADKGVDMLIDAWSFAAPDHPASQRMEVTFNGTKLPEVRLPVTPGEVPLRLHLDAPPWQAGVARGFVKIEFRFPDAKSPAELGLGGDVRLLGGAFRSIGFQAVR